MPATSIGPEFQRLLTAFACFAFLAACANEAESGAPESTEPAQTETALTPRLVAISVEDIDVSVAWYEQVLGFAAGERYEFPDDGMRMAFLQRGGFELELIELAGAAAYDAPDAGNPSTRQGFNKLAFHTNDIDARYAHVTDAGADVHTTLGDSRRLGRYFIVLDPDGNWIQVFGD